MQDDVPSRAPIDAAEASLWRCFMPLIALLAALLAVVLATVWAGFSFDTLIESRSALKAFVDGWPITSALAFCLAYFLIVALSIPGAVLMTVLSGFLFGPLSGGILSVLSATSGGVCVFQVARRSLGEMVRRRADSRIGAIARGIQRDAFSYLLCARLTPLFPFWLVNLAAGATGIPLRVFVSATLIGLLPLTFIFAYTGATLDSVLGRGKQALLACQGAGLPDCRARLTIGEILTPDLIIVGCVLGALALLPVALRALRVHLRT